MNKAYSLAYPVIHANGVLCHEHVCDLVVAVGVVEEEALKPVQLYPIHRSHRLTAVLASEP
jgi:hypothetical protein